MKKNSNRGYLYLLITFFLFGSVYVVSKYVLGKIPTSTISCSRFLLAFAALSFVAPKGTKKLERKDWKYIFLIGFAGYFIAVGAQLWGTKFAGVSLGSLLNALNPVAMTLFGALLLHERLTVNKVLGVFIALAGVYVVLGGNDGEINLVGAGLSLFSMTLWSFVSVLARKTNQKYDSLKVTRLSAGVATLFYLPMSIGELSGGAKAEWDLSCLLALCYLGIVCTGAGYYLWNKSLSLLEAGTCSAFYPLQPLVATGLGILFLGERVGLSFVAGGILIAAGIVINLSPWKQNKSSV